MTTTNSLPQTSEYIPVDLLPLKVAVVKAENAYSANQTTETSRALTDSAQRYFDALSSLLNSANPGKK